MLIPQNIIDHIIDQADIIEIISEYVPLKKMGANFKACCPFHNEKTPSFVVSPQKQIYHCFGCGAGGNVIGFLMNHDKLEFISAIERLAERLNIKIPQSRQGQSQSQDPKEEYFKINTLVHWFFQEEYKKSQKAQDYTQKRFLSPDIIKQFELGYGPDRFDALTGFLNQKKTSFPLACDLGVIKKRDSGGYYDFYRDRLIFPIYGLRQNIIGFGGRALSSATEAKYINSPESPIYNKGRELYGLFQAKKEIGIKNQVIVVEGYIDVLSCVQLGIKNVVAPLGTSLTSEQVKVLKRFTPEIVLMFDGDKAGKKAAIRGIETCFLAGIHPKLVFLSQNKDPGDYLADVNGKKSLSNSVQGAMSAMGWLFSAYLKKLAAQPIHKTRILRALVTWISKLSDPLERIEYQKKTAQYFDVPPQEIQKIVEITHQSDILPDHKIGSGGLEDRLVFLCIKETQWFFDSQVQALIQGFTNPKLQGLFLALQKIVKKHETFDPIHAITQLPMEFQGVLSELLLKGEEIPENYTIRDCLNQLYTQSNKKRRKDITARIVQAQLVKDEKLIARLLREQQELLQTGQAKEI